MIAMHRILAEKDLKPRKWKLEAVSSEDTDFEGNITYTWRPSKFMHALYIVLQSNRYV
jgi:hypothetical protein